MGFQCNLNLGVFARVIALAYAASFASADSWAAVDADIPQITEAAKKGYVSQEVELAGDYFAGRGVPQDAAKAAYWYQRAAESGNPAAENEIGFMYQAGVGVKVDLKKAMHWYQLASASGLPLAKVNVGVMYVWGLGVKKDYDLAAQLFREAAGKGDGAAANYLGLMYFFGFGVPQDRAAAESWYETGVKLHDPIAAFNLGTLFSGMDGHATNLERAGGLLREAAEQGYVPGMHSLGLFLVNHPEFARSPQEARFVLEKASEAGFWKSSVVLGMLARDGIGVSGGPERAYYYYQIAILQGGESAKQVVANDIKVLAPKLTPERTIALNSEAYDWGQQHAIKLDFIYRDNDNWKQFPAWARTASESGFHAGQLIPHPPA